ncbi:hypothetical protein [Micromonospora sp. WMMD964]|uniref:hypothetical protein n=1 Tax=Micromonospora sp. WMMD964 TaxID=3016091 RepID=UPI00249AE000|nr:hypothetical protein [Micromonospora sp. WMMD964]WFE98613.1 hypothetical protein O7616_17025 [Micromonospora sp. WMMD964]
MVGVSSPWCFGLADIQDEDPIRITGTRWAIEECIQTAKTKVGPDHHQVRRHDADTAT